MPVDVRTLRQPGAAPLAPAQSVVRVAGVQPYAVSLDALCVATDNDTLLRSPKLFRVAESGFRTLSTEGELASERPILLFVGAERCIHCRRLWQQLSLDEISARTAELDTRYLDADRHQELATLLGVRGLPSLLVIENGRPVARASVGQSVEELAKWLDGIGA